jgi:large subunit ribosomal protein L15
MLSLNNIKPARGATHRKKRVGCGESSGHGKTSGRGHKGQKARSGGSIRLGFEGGQMPLLRKMPKRGFISTFKKVWGIVNLSDLEQYDNGIVVDEAFLREMGFVDGNIYGVKILGDGELTKKITARVHAVSAGAREKIEKAGGTIEILPGYRIAAATE